MSNLHFKTKDNIRIIPFTNYFTKQKGKYVQILLQRKEINETQNLTYDGFIW